MTFTVVARCPRTHRLGVTMATRAPVVGARCPVVVPAYGAASVQLIANPRLTRLAGNLLGLGHGAGKVLSELCQTDPDIQRRQIGIVDAYGVAAAFSGPTENGFSGHILGRGYVAMGNAVVSEAVVDAIAAAMDADPEADLADRMMAAIEAGAAAGGQADGQFSGAMLVYGSEPFAEIDLRVDYVQNAVPELRRVYDYYRPLVPYYLERARDPYLPRDDRWRAANAG